MYFFSFLKIVVVLVMLSPQKFSEFILQNYGTSIYSIKSNLLQLFTLAIIFLRIISENDRVMPLRNTGAIAVEVIFHTFDFHALDVVLIPLLPLICKFPHYAVILIAFKP